MASASDKSLNDMSAFVELRYNGIAKAQLYTRVEAAEQEGDLSETWSSTEVFPNPDASRNLLDRATDFDRSSLFWEAGINYYPASSLRISVEGYIKSRENEYDFSKVLLADDDWTAYPGLIEEQQFYTEDINARVHWKPLPWLKSVSRIDVQNTTIDNKPRTSVEIEAAERERMVFNQSIVVTPHPRFFLNASYQLVEDLTETGATGIGQRHEGIIVNIPNDYWQFNANVFYVVAKSVDLQLGYSYLEMENYLDTSPTTVPYGSDIQQHHGSADVVLHINEATIARIGYHYYEQTSIPMEQNRDYTVNLVKASLQRKF